MADKSHDARIAATCFAHRTRMAARALNRVYDKALRDTGLKGTQLSLLVAAGMSDGKATITELADKLGLERSTLSRNLDPLERRELIALGAEGRHRSRTVQLTPAGRALLDDAYPRWADAQARVEQALGPDGAATMARLDALIRLA